MLFRLAAILRHGSFYPARLQLCAQLKTRFNSVNTRPLENVHHCKNFMYSSVSTCFHEAANTVRMGLHCRGHAPARLGSGNPELIEAEPFLRVMQPKSCGALAAVLWPSCGQKKRRLQFRMILIWSYSSGIESIGVGKALAMQLRTWGVRSRDIALSAPHTIRSIEQPHDDVHRRHIFSFVAMRRDRCG